jgi:signal transduction histidine kinase
VVAAELDRARLLADLAVALPSGADDGGPWRRITLLDSRGEVLVQSGAPAGEGEAAAAVERRLAPPLAAWTLRAELVGAGGPGALGGFLRAAALVVVAAVLVGLAVVFYRESSRELREAAQRVRFVNQVSHELRTPLTNIRLYAELAEHRLADDDEARSHLAVIVAESARLGRLIGNVLSFARSRRGELAVHPVPGVVDDTLRAVAAQFEPSLQSRGVELALDLDAPRPIPFDADAVEQVVGNLLANVEKYAAAGGRAEINSRQGGGATIVRVADRGPGIPAAAAERIFEPFVRLSDRLTEGVSGTGIGLAIARDLARAHGGELRLEPSERGACFALELPGPTEGGER